MLHLKDNKRFIDFAKREIIFLKPGQMRCCKMHLKSAKEIRRHQYGITLYSDLGMVRWCDSIPGSVELTTKN